MIPWNDLSGSGAFWRAEYEVPSFGPVNSVATALDGGYAVVSPPDDDQPLDGFRTIGRVTAIMAPSGSHDLGIERWRRAHPGAPVFAPREALRGLGTAGHCRGVPLGDMRVPAGLTVPEAPGTRKGSCLFLDERGSRPCAYVDEAVLNLRQLPGPLLPKALFWLTRSAAGPRIARFYMRAFVRDRAALAAAVTSVLDATASGVAIPAHGNPITGGDLARLAAELRAASDARSRAPAGVAAWRR